MGESTPLAEAEGHLEAGRSIEAMNVLMGEWQTSPGDPALRLGLARVANRIKSAMHKKALYREVGGGDHRFGELVGDRYILLQRISESTGVSIYRAHDEEAGTYATLWYLEPLWRNSSLDQGWVVDRLKEIGGEQYPYAARLLRGGAPTDDLVYAALEPVEGNLLSDQIASGGPLPIEEGVTTMVKILEALVEIHKGGRVHGNLRPDHIDLREDGVRLLDVGLYPLIRSLHRAKKMTRTGQVPGSLAYLPPEFERAEDPDVLWHLCSAGTIAFEILTGEPPYGRPQPRQYRAFLMKMQEPVIPRASQTPGGSGLPGWADVVLAKMIARDPAQRYPGAAEALEAWKQHA